MGKVFKNLWKVLSLINQNSRTLQTKSVCFLIKNINLLIDLF